MSSLLWTAGAVAVVAGALLLICALFFARSRRGSEGDGRPAASHAWNAIGSGDAVQVRLAPEDLNLIRHDIRILNDMHSELRRVGDLLARILKETNAAHPARLNPPRPESSGALGRAGFGGSIQPTSPEPIQSAPSRRIDPDLRVQHDGGFEPNPLPAPGIAQPREPSPDAVNVEASHDIVVSSVRHPPEAWMERGEVWLNPRVTLTDPALQRWSTFFEWERREPGARYQTTRPASVTASGGVVRKGLARPL